jgi:hypothetical protein
MFTKLLSKLLILVNVTLKNIFKILNVSLLLALKR